MITLDQVSKIYLIRNKPPVEAVHEINLQFSSGEFAVITGRSGSGKTTLLNLIAGLARPTSGKILVDDVDIWSLTDAQRSALRNRKMGFVFQFPSLLQSLTAEENVVLPTLFHHRKASQSDFERAQYFLELVGLKHKSSAYPRHLSAGEQQRIVIARALINKPELILADEPTSNLDEQTEKEIMALFEEIHSRNGITILLVTHVEQLVTHGTRNIHLINGAISQDNSRANNLVVDKVKEQP